MGVAVKSRVSSEVVKGPVRPVTLGRGRAEPPRGRHAVLRPASALVIGLDLAALAAILYAVAVALQSLEAHEAPARERLHSKLVERLVSEPRWLVGTGTSRTTGPRSGQPPHGRSLTGVGSACRPARAT